MAPTKKQQKSAKKEKIFHPESRKAGQLARKQLRKSKLAGQASKRAKVHSAKEERGNVLTLSELHDLVSDVWLARHDEELEEERAARRKGRPKSAREIKLEEIKLREAGEYRTGMEVPDLTHPENIALYRTWDQREVAFVQLLRFIRISSTKPDTAILSRPGRHPSLVSEQNDASPMDVEAVA